MRFALFSLILIHLTKNIKELFRRYIEVRNRQTDPNWKLVQQIYNMENALKEVDEDYACKSLSKVTPFSYTDEYREDTGINTDAIGMVINFDQIQNRRDCKVNAYDAFRCEIGEHSYLCRTISPEISCVIEYSADVIGEADIFRMAESVQMPIE